MNGYYVLLGFTLGIGYTWIRSQFRDVKNRRVSLVFGQRDKVEDVLSWLRNGGLAPTEAAYRLNALGVPYNRRVELLKLRGCGKRLAAGQWWSFCGETDMGQTTPARCEKCDPENGFKLRQ